MMTRLYRLRLTVCDRDFATFAEAHQAWSAAVEAFKIGVLDYASLVVTRHLSVDAHPALQSAHEVLWTVVVARYRDGVVRGALHVPALDCIDDPEMNTSRALLCGVARGVTSSMVTHQERA